MSWTGNGHTPAQQSMSHHVVAQTCTESSSPLTPLLKEEIKKTIMSRRTVQELAELRSHKEHSKPTQLTPQEEERRRARREKNRLAAAKCRDRQRDKADTLFRETQMLEAQNNSLRKEIKKLAEEKSQLSFALSIHQLQSSVGNHSCKLLMANERQALEQRPELAQGVPSSVPPTQAMGLWTARAHSQHPREVAHDNS